MTAENSHTRRSVLVTGGAVAGAALGAVALTACGGDAAPGGSAPAPAAPPAPAGQNLAALDAVPVGSAVAVTVPGGQQAIVSRRDENAVAGFSAACTHRGCPVAPQGTELRCPCHGSVFDAFTGAVKGGPAEAPLTAIPVRVENGQIVTA
ncbi:Rieske (2Fe-2S) protein [Saccharopolyspora sp. 5N708]|uniref:Rieske (2Fe-2S) protein n=1 Tax=Saccharopolyspora sp. 5N708 TaxID=3457424 RepID=UPI003FD25F45